MAMLPSTSRPPREDHSSRGGRARSAAFQVLFLALLVGGVAATWLWGPKFSVVLSQSMDPTYTTGDALLVVPWGSPGVGDIVQFTVPIAPGRPETAIPVAHRIIGVDERGFITKGDNPIAQPDYWRIQPDQITGHVVWWFPQVWMFRIAAALIGIAVLMLLWPRGAAEAEDDEDDEGGDDADHKGADDTTDNPAAPDGAPLLDKRGAALA